MLEWHKAAPLVSNKELMASAEREDLLAAFANTMDVINTSSIKDFASVTGGKRCQTPGCKSRAKHQNRCWKHGGSTECKIPSCLNRAKSRGFCWSHGGGTKCKADNCEKIAISNGLCWAHGGGKRCIVEGCMRQAYERTENLCNSHFLKLPHDEEEVGDGMANTELTLEQYLELAAPPGN
ncbi:hypothetical protein CCR75_006009 [Bremia lactucae]|uniref:WRKY19-like zinc finger domain-containing protein n=1 Tax=Bremia lactucae TaxID=4779 RepID=A0A976FJK7_BRELC|nr:hypothetical protein CCR75_006009 [Bremia lactucae]